MSNIINPYNKANFFHNCKGGLTSSMLAIGVLALNIPTVVHAQVAGEPAFQKMRDLIFQYAGLIGAFLIVPIGVLALIVNVVQLIWQLMTGETHGVGKKLGWILFTILLTAFGVWLGTNAQGIFA
jgi:hypothetical protein